MPAVTMTRPDDIENPGTRPDVILALLALGAMLDRNDRTILVGHYPSAQLLVNHGLATLTPVPGTWNRSILELTPAGTVALGICKSDQTRKGGDNV